MGTSLVVNSTNFETEVIQKSYEKPVLVDFFATWCGPCQMLKPMLEKLVQEYDFVLAKLDIDQNPELANTYGVQGVPDVRIVLQGQLYEGFVGVLPEPKIRELLVQLNLKSALEVGLNAIQVARTAGDIEEASRLFSDLIEKYPQNHYLILDAAKFLISQNQPESANELLSTIQEHEKEFFPQAQALKTLIQFQQDCQHPVIESELDKMYLKAEKLTLEENYEAALQTFLEIVGCDRKYRNDGARKAMITLFDLLGDDHPLTKDYRKKLMLTLY